jgi:hypothetical protein
MPKKEPKVKINSDKEKKDIKAPEGDTRKKNSKSKKQLTGSESTLPTNISVTTEKPIQPTQIIEEKKTLVKVKEEHNVEIIDTTVTNNLNTPVAENNSVSQSNLIIDADNTTGVTDNTNVDDKKDDIPIVKKRGRRPKQKTEEELAKAAAAVTNTTNTKKKGKNPKESYGLNDDYQEEDPFFNQSEPEKECVETPIMRLNVTANDIKKIKDPNFNISDGDNELNIPSAFNVDDGFSYFQGSNMNGSQLNKDNSITEDDLQKFRNTRDKELENVNHDNNNESKLLNQYIEHNKKGTWPEKSVYDCMWCRFPFDNTPWAIPYRLTINDKFEVFGNFCSPNCAAAYIFDSFDDDEMWDRYALLNMLYQRVYNLPGAVVKASPDVLFLKKLGGILSIEEYREISGNPNKSYFLKMPPMVSIIPSVEELQQTSLFNENNGNREHLNKELMMKANDELRLRRSKPVYDKDNTLDNYFHIPKN